MGIRLSSYGAGKITVDGLTDEDIKRIRAAGHGLSWVMVKDGKLLTHSALLPPPDPIHDDEMLPFWSRPTAEEKENLEKFEFEKLDPRFYCGRQITIQHLCGYSYTKENYRREAFKLESYGFSQMRSQRGIDGGFWEVWFLPGLYSAKGDLHHVIEEAKSKKKLVTSADGSQQENDGFAEAIEFLRTHVQFGTLEVSVQRLVMLMDD